MLQRQRRSPSAISEDEQSDFFERDDSSYSSDTLEDEDNFRSSLASTHIHPPNTKTTCPGEDRRGLHAAKIHHGQASFIDSTSPSEDLANAFLLSDLSIQAQRKSARQQERDIKSRYRMLMNNSMADFPGLKLISKPIQRLSRPNTLDRSFLRDVLSFRCKNLLVDELTGTIVECFTKAKDRRNLVQQSNSAFLVEDDSEMRREEEENGDDEEEATYEASEAVNNMRVKKKASKGSSGAGSAFWKALWPPGVPFPIEEPDAARPSVPALLKRLSLPRPLLPRASSSQCRLHRPDLPIIEELLDSEGDVVMESDFTQIWREGCRVMDQMNRDRHIYEPYERLFTTINDQQEQVASATPSPELATPPPEVATPTLQLPNSSVEVNKFLPELATAEPLPLSTLPFPPAAAVTVEKSAPCLSDLPSLVRPQDSDDEDDDIEIIGFNFKEPASKPTRPFRPSWLKVHHNIDLTEDD